MTIRPLGHRARERKRHQLSSIALLGLAVCSLQLPNTATSQVSVSAPLQQLCDADGVVKCIGFESQDAIVPDLISDSTGTVYPHVDNTLSASGSGSLKFTIPSLSSGNSSGAYFSDLGGSFGQGDSFYVSFKQRFSPDMVNTDFGGNGWKQVILHGAGSSCAAVEITTQNTYHRGFPQLYSRCGADHLTVDLSNGDFLLQQGEYECHYQGINANDCSMYTANEWITFYYEIHVGEWGLPNSSINAYIAYEGGPLQQFVDIDNYTLRYNDSPSDSFAKIQLTPYNTNKPADLSHPVAYTWYDDLIVSTRPIYDVSLAPAPEPNPPSTLKVE